MSTVSLKIPTKKQMDNYLKCLKSNLEDVKKEKPELYSDYLEVKEKLSFNQKTILYSSKEIDRLKKTLRTVSDEKRKKSLQSVIKNLEKERRHFLKSSKGSLKKKKLTQAEKKNSKDIPRYYSKRKCIMYSEIFTQKINLYEEFFFRVQKKFIFFLTQMKKNINYLILA